MKRRNFLTNLGTTGVGLTLLGKVSQVQAKPKGDAPDQMFNMALNPVPGVTAPVSGKVVVVGGGMAGTTISKYLRLWGGAGMDVTLVEPNANYYSNIYSNMILTGDKTLAQLTYNYNNLINNYGVKVVNSSVSSINAGGKSVSLANGSSLTYDRLVLALGIDFDSLPYVDPNNANVSKIVHAWQAGPQTTNLQKQIQAMTKSDTFILIIPPAPYRCPPGPYERACVVADYLKRVKGGGKVIVLDANAAITAQPTNFGNAFNVTYKGIITYIPGSTLTSIDAANMTVVTNKGSYVGKVINAIPKHKAPKLIFDALLNTSD
ncbi:MAG: FAD-dependent oxidoreductase, partial [Chitinophagaceae bacterium]